MLRMEMFDTKLQKSYISRFLFMFYLSYVTQTFILDLLKYMHFYILFIQIYIVLLLIYSLCLLFPVVGSLLARVILVSGGQ